MSQILSSCYYSLANFGEVRNKYLAIFEKAYMGFSFTLLVLGVLILYVGVGFTKTMTEKYNTAMRSIQTIIIY